MAAIDDLRTAYAQVCQRIVELTASAQPTVSIDGETVNTAEYLQTLLEARERLKKAIQDEESPFVIVTRLRP